MNVYSLLIHTHAHKATCRCTHDVEYDMPVSNGWTQCSKIICWGKIFRRYSTLVNL